jgi:L,D-transpeptidase ErfK/SrfK
MGKFSVTGKTVNPTWVIPPGILRDHIRERGDYRRMIKGGDPDNPLGKYRFELSLEPYRIHGTNIPWGMGMTVSNGCTRLYPEDVELLFPIVKVGTRGEFIYQPIKVGVRNGQVYVEAHPDLYNLGSRIPPGGSSMLKAAGVDSSNPRLEAVLHEAKGVPSLVGSEPSRAASL